jgi:hypothetical protein
LQQTRGAIDVATQAVAAAQHRLRAITARLARLERTFNPNDEPQVVERESLRAQLAQASEDVTRQRGARADAVGVENGLVDLFIPFTDPREGIAQLDDGTPILLMPVRLETRFKDIAVPGSPAPRRELWVRVYPDDIWVDSFDPTLTDTEVVNAKTYWTQIWEAGGIEDQDRGAWRGLVAAHGSGRASWIVEAFQPANLPQKPAKTQPQDVVLTIPTDSALTPAEELAAKEFWRQVWLADGDAAKTDAAIAALEAALGAARAGDILARYQPVNLSAPLAAGFTKADVAVSVAVVVFGPVETKQNAWSSAPRVTILPDRFVFIGYEGTQAPMVVLGKAVASSLAVGPDPSAPKEEQLQHDAQGNLVVPDDMKWIADFDRAVDVGMAFRIPLTELQARSGFDRVLVVGLRLRADEQSSKIELETLLRHHALRRTGLSLVPQGTPTNNTEAAGSGHGRQDDPDQSFDDRKAPLFTQETDWLNKADGQWLAEYLGIDAAVLEHVHHAGSTDQRVARAMNTALWPATLGYWMETMMAPVFPRDAISRTRGFFNRFVIGSGAVPAIRVGSQPYGILPATTWSRMDWLDQRSGDPLFPYLRRLYSLLRGIQNDLEGPFAGVSYVGKAGDPHHLLLDVVGLHPGSVEWSQRYAEDFKTLIKRLNLLGSEEQEQAFGLAMERMLAVNLLGLLGYSGPVTPQVLDKVFAGKHNLLKGGLVDDKPLSETEGIRPYTTANANYVQWLIDAANTSLDALYKQDGFINDTPPAALLFILLRHALQLGYHDVSLLLYEAAGLLTVQQAAQARSDDPFIHVRSNALASESRYQTLYAAEPVITGSATQTVGNYIAAQLGALLVASSLRDQIDALERLKGEPTARLERALADHVDCCAYRLDSWMLGLAHVQLALMRNIRDREEAPVRQGSYLGAYGWLEHLRPEHKVLTPVALRDPALQEDFGGEPPLVRDNTNQGFIHAPSLNHAVAAAVLRNGYISNASPQNRQTMAVNLTSERVRTALAMIEGIRAGQGLGDLLGYQLERGLHDRHNLVEVDKFIYKLRKAFPLRADHFQSTKTAEGVAIEAIEARNVVDGLALVEHIKETGSKTYPFGKPSLPVALPAEADAINAEVDRLLESHDAVADLALAEGVYQAVLGNYDRVASTYDAYARGHFPPEPDVIRTPFNGIGLTHRVAVHLEGGASHTASPVVGIGMTPRAQGEPALNRWLASVLPPPEQVSCVVSLREAATGAEVEREVTLRQLALQPIDLIAILRHDSRQAMSELDDRVMRFAVESFGPRPDVQIAIQYMKKQAAAFSVFELWPLVRALRQLTTTSRPLKATDLTLMNEATSSQDVDVFVDDQRLIVVRDAMKAARDSLEVLRADLEGPLADLENRRAEILATTDDYIAALATGLGRAALFAVPQAGWGFAYDFRRRAFAAMLQQCADRVTRWDDRLAEFDDRITEYNALPAATTDEERFRLLSQAERAISTIETTPLPASPAAYLTHLSTVKRPAFVAKRQQLADVEDTAIAGVSALHALIASILPTSDFDLVEFTLTEREDAMVLFAEDALRVVTVVISELDRRLAAAKAQLDAHQEAAAAPERVRALERAAQALLGADFRIFPEFGVTAAQGQELQNALNASRSGDLFKYLTTPPDANTPALEDVPVDTWLYGVARVRTKMRAWEQTVMMTGSLGVTEPELDAMQLPVVAGDRWLGLEFPPEMPLSTDRLLYTAHVAAPFNGTARQCGMLIDEWTETIPGPTADTGITFHHDRPSSEAPQAMLLVTPSRFRGAWQWNDLVDALNETLEFAKRRAIEPSHIDATVYAPFLPATIMAVQVRQLTISANLSLNNKIELLLPQG